eukprot:3905441-Alexandrium_andersonii.AAC.1
MAEEGSRDFYCRAVRPIKLSVGWVRAMSGSARKLQAHAPPSPQSAFSRRALRVCTSGYPGKETAGNNFLQFPASDEIA